MRQGLWGLGGVLVQGLGLMFRIGAGRFLDACVCVCYLFEGGGWMAGLIPAVDVRPGYCESLA